MRRSEFTYRLPADLIAQHPSEQREDSRLLCLDSRSGEIRDRQFRDLISLLNTNDILVFNDTRVIPARLYGKKESGGKVEIMLERLLEENTMLARLRFSKTPKPGSKIIVEDQYMFEVTGTEGEMFILRLKGGDEIVDILDKIGHVPLPPYIQRNDETIDRERYQTVYARKSGAVAAPTAGLHFSEDIMGQLIKKDINMAFLTLHVGAGTFQPVRSEHIEDHRMHSEYMEVSAEVCNMINRTKAKGGRVIAVGTTSVRSLETAALAGELQPYSGETDIFITPGFNFRVVDALITNFHLPESTLLMLVCAFAGRENILHAYEHAIEQKYRFYSYGDAMLIY